MQKLDLVEGQNLLQEREKWRHQTSKYGLEENGVQPRRERAALRTLAPCSLFLPAAISLILSSASAVWMRVPTSAGASSSSCCASAGTFAIAALPFLGPMVEERRAAELGEGGGAPETQERRRQEQGDGRTNDAVTAA